MESEGLSVQQVLREAIKAMGRQNFACKSGLSARSVSDFVAERREWSLDKVSQHIKKFLSLSWLCQLKSPLDRLRALLAREKAQKPHSSVYGLDNRKFCVIYKSIKRWRNVDGSNAKADGY